MSFEFKQIITQILAFLIMLWILKRYAWKPLMAILDQRTRKIQHSFDEIDEKNRQADARLAEYEHKIAKVKEEGQLIIQTSVKEARRVAQEIQTDSQKKAHEILNKAQEEADRELDKARIKLKKNIVDLTFHAFEKLIKMRLTQEDKERFSLALIDEVKK